MVLKPRSIDALSQCRDKTLIVLYQNKYKNVHSTPSCVLTKFEKCVKQYKTKHPECLLRLKGGMEDEVIRRPRPLEMCRTLLESYDRLVDAYKKAMIESNYNVIEEMCKKKCGGVKDEITEYIENDPINQQVSAAPRDTQVSACGIPSCPYARALAVNEDKAFQNRQMKSACGNPSCPFTKSRLGTAGPDEWTELQFIYTNNNCISNLCGYHECPFLSITSKPLPPIHWDCANPLPDGPCKNPQCPLKPKELQYNPELAGPCGSPNCPYTPLPYCGNIQCPFASPRTPPAPPMSPTRPSSPSNNSSKKCSDPNCLSSGKNNFNRKKCDPNCSSNSKNTVDKKDCGDPNCAYSQSATGKNSQDPFVKKNSSKGLNNKKKVATVSERSNKERSSSNKKRNSKSEKNSSTPKSKKRSPVKGERNRSSSSEKRGTLKSGGGSPNNGKKRGPSKDDKSLPISKKLQNVSKVTACPSTCNMATSSANAKDRSSSKFCGDPLCQAANQSPSSSQTCRSPCVASSKSSTGPICSSPCSTICSSFCKTPCLSPIVPCCTYYGCPANPPRCSDPQCPLNLPPKPCPALYPCLKSSSPLCPHQNPCLPPPCVNPRCPILNQERTTCLNPNCPFEKNEPVEIGSACPNPQCPFKKQIYLEICNAYPSKSDKKQDSPLKTKKK